MEESDSIQIITDPVGTVSSSLETKKKVRILRIPDPKHWFPRSLWKGQ